MSRDSDKVAMPDLELRVWPRWLIFSADGGYEKPQVMRVRLTNTDNQRPVVFHFRQKYAQVPRIVPRAGWIEPGAAAEVDVFLPSAQSWPRCPLSFAGQRHRVLLESLHPPLDASNPPSAGESANYAKGLFRAAPIMSTMYTKLSIMLPKLRDSGDLY